MNATYEGPRYLTFELQRLPTIAEGYTSNLKVDSGKVRVWLARTGIEDGEPFEHTVYVERLEDGRWIDAGRYDGDAPGNR